MKFIELYKQGKLIGCYSEIKRLIESVGKHLKSGYVEDTDDLKVKENGNLIAFDDWFAKFKKGVRNG